MPFENISIEKSRRDQASAIADKKNASKLARAIRSLPEWSMLSRNIRETQQFCADPFLIHQDFLEACVEVHHIKPITKHPELWNHRDNLIGLCKECHKVADYLNQKECQIVYRLMDDSKRNLAKKFEKFKQEADNYRCNIHKGIKRNHYSLDNALRNEH